MEFNPTVSLGHEETDTERILLKTTTDILHRARTNNFTICMEIQKTSNSQSNLEKEEWNWRNQPT